ncbi:MAG: glycosyltransferase family 4 protein [Deltaproteobacteria bacterium HGW-Deltaproteobacteria-1]|jgi:glycosyltransferase involved in cell wall biosynthesis|nr:MAG: glycosyltransferase family 4 protein [Deltaproteobacteria bacterium HGW-Deltaproteobacteria-1]
MKDNPKYRPRVLVLTSTFPRWENDPEPAFIFELCRRLISYYNITVLAPRTPGGKMRETLAGLHVVRFPYFFNRWEKLAMHGGGILNKLKTNPAYYLMVPIFLLGQLLALVRLLRHERFDLIHAHWLIPQGLISVLGIILSYRRIPLLCTSHGGDIFALRGMILQRMKRWVMDKSVALTVVSQAIKNKVVDMGITPDKVQVISMGVDLKHLFTPDPKVTRSSNELLFVGRLVEVKGLPVLLKAMPKLLFHNPDIHLSVAGAGPLETGLRELLLQLNILDKVDFLGMVSQRQLPVLYQRATLAIFPFVMTKSGIQEGFGLVVVEAMGCECPVIAGDLPAIHDSITHGESGLLVPSGNCEVLADTIIRSLNDPDLRFRLAREGRKRVVEEFDWEVIAEKYKKLYNKLIRVD